MIRALFADEARSPMRIDADLLIALRRIRVFFLCPSLSSFPQ